MNRRTVVTGAVALAASAFAPASLAAVRSAAAAPDKLSFAAYDFARLVMGLPADSQMILAAMLRTVPARPPEFDALADVIERIARRGGWVRGDEWRTLVEPGRGTVAFVKVTPT